MWRQWMLTLVMLLCMVGVSTAGDWKFNIMGISPEDFKGRDWKMIVVGAVASLAVHELGHAVIARTNGGVSFDWNERAVMWSGYQNHSHDTQQWFHRAGFVSQLLVGSILTAIEDTRHTDFVLGFNGFTTGNTAMYTITGGGNKRYSDILQLDNGRTEGTLYSLGAGVLTYINLNKE